MALPDELILRLSSQGVGSTTSTGTWPIWIDAIPEQSTRDRAVLLRESGGFGPYDTAETGELFRPTFQVLVRGDATTDAPRTNYLPDQNLVSTGWFGNSSGISSGSIDPYGGKNGFTFASSNAGSRRYNMGSVGAAPSTIAQVTVYVRKETANTLFSVALTDNTATPVSRFFKWGSSGGPVANTTGVPGSTGTYVSTAGAIVDTVQWRNTGYWRVRVESTSAVTAATSGTFRVALNVLGSTASTAVYGKQVLMYGPVVNVGGTGVVSPRTKMHEAVESLHRWSGTIGSRKYIDVTLQGDVTALGEDENRRTMYAANFLALRSQTT